MAFHERQEDLPPYLRWVQTFISRTGFPIVAAIGMWYLCEITIKKQTETMLGFKEVLIQVKDTLEQQNKILRRKSKDD